MWAVAFSIIATIVLQEMAARLGLVSREGLGEALRSTFSNRLARFAAVGLVVAAITFGNAAFQMGNILGAAMGLELLTGIPRQFIVLGIGLATFALLAVGTYKAVERFLIALVILMGVVFLLTAVMLRPDLSEIAAAVARPKLPSGSMLTAIALIGTTVVPYNLFLHACSVQEKWSASLPVRSSLRAARIDSMLTITLGGVITAAVVVTAAAAFERGAAISGAADMAGQIELLLGPASKILFPLGLAAAGLTSAVTAPLAAAYATAGALGFERNLRSWKFRGVWAAILLVGTVLAFVGHRPIEAIQLAQAANGILLPVIAVFLLVVMNRRDLLGRHKNGPLANLLGILVVLVTSGLGLTQILRVLRIIQ